MGMDKRTVGLLFNTQKQSAVELAQRLLKWGVEGGIDFLLPPHEAAQLRLPSTMDDAWRKGVEFAVVIGGDGTFLRAARYVFESSDPREQLIPLYGINVGRLGFLAIGDPHSAESDIRAILDGKHSILPRHLVRGEVLRAGVVRHVLYALNDLVITKGAFARAIDIKISVGQRSPQGEANMFAHEELSSMLADGLIVSTPTGSTAYALSAGGPIVPPHVPCMILAPLCAHTLYARPVILSENDVALIAPCGDNRDLMLTQDGQLGYEILPGDLIQVSLEPDLKLNTIMLPQRSYYTLLRQKLQWGYSGMDRGNGLC